MSEAETIYTSVRDSYNDSEVVVYQNIHRAGSSDSPFNTLAVSGKHYELILGTNVIKHNLSLSYVGPIGRQCLAPAQPETQNMYSSCLCILV